MSKKVIIRKMDNKGKITIPQSVREKVSENLSSCDGEFFAIYAEGHRIILEWVEE